MCKYHMFIMFLVMAMAAEAFFSLPAGKNRRVRASGNGPVRHMRQAPSRRSNTIARPLAGSPAAPVREAGIASPTTEKAGGEPPAEGAQKPVAATSAVLGSAEGFRRDCAEPSFRISRFEPPEGGWCIGRAQPAGTLDINELPVAWMVNAG